MTSSNGNTFRGNGPLCEEFTGHRRIPLTKASNAELWCFLWSARYINGWVNNHEAGDLRRNRAHYDVSVMILSLLVLRSDVIAAYAMASCVAKSSAPTELSQCRIWYIKYKNSFAFSKTHLARKMLTARFSFVLRCRYYLRKIAYGLFTMKIQNWHSGSSMTNRYFLSSAESPSDSVYEGIEKKSINPRKAVYKGNRGHIPMLNETRSLLKDFYRPHNNRLACLLGDERYLWQQEITIDCVSCIVL